MVNLASYSWTEYCNFNLKSRKNSCPKKVVFIFCRNFAGDFFRRQRIFADFKTEFWKVSSSHAYIPISSARNYRPCFRENQPKRSFSIKWKRAFWACFRENRVYKFGHRWCYGEHLLRKFIRKPQFCSKRWSSRAQNIVLFSFAAKSTLRIKLQCWFFLWRYMNASPFEISKKIAKIYFYFWLISFRLQKTEWSFKATHEQ